MKGIADLMNSPAGGAVERKRKIRKRRARKKERKQTTREGGEHTANTEVFCRRALSRPSFDVSPLPRRFIAVWGFWRLDRLSEKAEAADARLERPER